MKKFILTVIYLFLFISISSAIILSTIGVETKRFNNLISKKINENNNNLEIRLVSVKFKLDVKELSLFLETNNPSINYRGAVIPAKNIKMYVDFLSILKSEAKIDKINLTLSQINIEELKKLSIIFKPSNLTSFINNNIFQGKLNSEIEVYLDKNNLLDNYIARGSITDLKAKIKDDIVFEKTTFKFIADKSDILVKNFSSQTKSFIINEGDLKVQFSPDVSLEANFNSNLNYNSKIENYQNLFEILNIDENLLTLEAKLSNNFSLNFDKTYKVKEFRFSTNGNISKSRLKFNDLKKNIFLSEKVSQLELNNSKIKMTIDQKSNKFNLAGNYSFNEKNFLPFNLGYSSTNKNSKIKLSADYDKEVEISQINYKKQKGTIAKIFIDIDSSKNKFNINEASYAENKNSITANGIKFEKGQFSSFDKILIKTFKNNEKNNDFSITFGKKIKIEGNQFDATNLPKILSKKTNSNILSGLSKDIEINLSHITAPLSEKLKNFKLLGEIENGKFTKISSKGDFEDNNFLDITMKSDEKKQVKYLEIYSDLTKPLLTEFNFFKGLSGGKLLFSSVISEGSSDSKLKIENFKVINAPGMVKLLSLADLGGLADLAEGEGISFQILEISMQKKKDVLKLNEILALGPSISVLMEGYKDSKITSLRGTLVPAKTLNKLISKIPVIGDIVIPKEVGEGLFGISFKMKGPPGKIKTTINPIRTITPRFIQKIIDKKKTIK